MSAPAFTALRDDPKFAQAVGILCNRSRVELGALVCNPWMPETLIETILDWIDDLGAGDPSSAFDLEVLEAVFPALGVAWLVSYSYSGRPVPVSGPGAAPIVVEMRDVGDPAIVGRALEVLAAITAALHGEVGAELVRRTDADVQEKLMKIAIMVARHA